MYNGVHTSCIQSSLIAFGAKKILSWHRRGDKWLLEAGPPHRNNNTLWPMWSRPQPPVPGPGHWPSLVTVSPGPMSEAPLPLSPVASFSMNIYVLSQWRDDAGTGAGVRGLAWCSHHTVKHRPGPASHCTIGNQANVCSPETFLVFLMAPLALKDI